MKVSPTHHVTKKGIVKANPPSQQKSPLDLPDLDQFTGTEQYHNVMGVQVTDGVAYVMQSGYSWAVTDAITLLKMLPKLRGQEFVAIKLKLHEKGATITYDDGNGKILHKQMYEWTNARKEFTMFYTGGVLLLSGEY